MQFVGENVAFIDHVEALVYTGNKSSNQLKVSTPSTPVQDQYETSSSVIADWGTDNLFPTNVRKAIESNPDLAAGLDWKARALYAGGVKYQVLENGRYIEKSIAEIDVFLKRNRRYPIESVNQFYWYYNVFPEFVLTKNRAKIYYLTAQNPEYCRYKLADDKTGLIDTMYINANWEWGASHADSKTITVPVIDPILEPDLFMKLGSKYKYIYPLSYPTGKAYYQLAHWNTLRKSGWLEHANLIPAFKKALLNNQISVKYIIHVPDHWWTWKYPNFNTYGEKQRNEIQRKELKRFNDFLAGAENAGKSIMLTFLTNPNTKQEYASWKVEEMDNKLKDGIYIEDSVEATIKIFSALGVDPALAGIIPGKGGSNRSGSDKREAFNAYISLCNIHADIVLEPYDIVSEYNGWNNKYGQIKWGFNQPLMQTLDKLNPSQRSTIIEDN
ncbi:hypothetical protein [Chondrinema litorale]|uniref:hypothetical protein n=1 Tax=Chondrinema litorale TaxID=2994555 RepID=UPI002543236F|nr:hypothetical protein [Chondrinema litorale]UZR95936.1 hypothetical protein OQ292_08935 [Chondrinema litorale]